MNAEQMLSLLDRATEKLIAFKRDPEIMQALEYISIVSIALHEGED